MGTKLRSVDIPVDVPLIQPPVDFGNSGTEMDTNDSITMGKMERALRQLSGSSAAGLDGVPPMLLKRMGRQTRMVMLAALNSVLTTGRVPRSWGRSRMRLIWKKGTDKSLPESYRPITVTAAMYRLFCHILRARIQVWAEGVLGELQNGFRPGRCLEDNLFIVTQAVEIAAKEGRTLLLAFLDVAQAYDTVETRRLWSILRALGLQENLLRLLEALYEDTQVVIHWGCRNTNTIAVSRGLRQGCPLSPLLFMLFVSSLERRLAESGRGFDVTYMKQRGSKVQRLPALFYADDIVLMAENSTDMQSLLDICSDEGSALGLTFSARKSASMRYAPEGDDVDDTRLSLQGNGIERVVAYKYLGVTLTAAPCYTQGFEEELRKKAVARRAFLGSRALWGFSRFEVARELWKSVAVPALTFGNAVLCTAASTQRALEARQREAGRAALGVHKGVPNEAIQGDLGWSSFEAREAVAKLAYERRLSQMPDGRWAREVYKYITLRCITTKWVARTKRLAERYGVAPVRLAETAERGWREKVRRQVSRVEEERWRKAAEEKPALAVYSGGKADIGKELFYENSTGSGLLFEARSGMLRTRQLRAKYTAGIDATCPSCGLAEETVAHIVLECPGLRPPPSDGAAHSLAIALGFRGRGEQPNWQAVETTKRRLGLWWRNRATQTPTPTASNQIPRLE